MSTTMLMILSFLAGSFYALHAKAEIVEPNEYITLTAVELAPEKAPRLNGGMKDLGDFEGLYDEKLPMQLTKSMRKIEKAKYRPSSRN